MSIFRTNAGVGLGRYAGECDGEWLDDGVGGEKGAGFEVGDVKFLVGVEEGFFFVS